MGLFPIFNLLCNHPKGVTCEIPRTLLVLSSSLAKATALRILEGVNSPSLSTRLPVVKSSLRSVLRCARNSRMVVFHQTRTLPLWLASQTSQPFPQYVRNIFVCRVMDLFRS